MAIIIAAKRHGFRRCGIAHSSEPTLYRDDHFTAAQLQALGKDPQLVVSYVDADLDDQQELLNDTAPNPLPAQAGITRESALPRLGQADPAAMGDAGPNLQDGASLGLNLPPLAGGEIDLGIEGLWDEAFKEDTDRHAARLVAELWDEALAEEAQRETAKVKAEPKPKKATAKTGSLDK